MGTAAFPHPPPFCQSVFSSKRVISQAEKRRENIKVSYQNWLGIFPEILKMLETNCNRNRGISSAFLTEDKKKPISAVPAGSRKISFPQSSSTTEPPNLQLPSHPQLHGSIPSRNLQREWEIQTDQCTSQTRAIKMKREKKRKGNKKGWGPIDILCLPSHLLDGQFLRAKPHQRLRNGEARSTTLLILGKPNTRLAFPSLPTPTSAPDPQHPHAQPLHKDFISSKP